MEQKFNVGTRINSTHLILLNVFNAYRHFGSIHSKIKNKIQKVYKIATETMVISIFVPSDSGYLISVFVMTVRPKRNCEFFEKSCYIVGNRTREGKRKQILNFESAAFHPRSDKKRKDS